MIVNHTPLHEKPRKLRGISEQLNARFGPRQPRVVVVDGSPEFRDAFRGLLQDLGLLAEVVSSPSEALPLIAGPKPPDLIVLELNVTSDERFDFAEQLQSQGPMGKETPIIFTAASKDVQTVVTALTYYAEDYVVKPCHLAELAVRVQRVLLRTGPLHQDDLEHPIDERLHINFTQRYVVINGQRSSLTPTENRIFQTLYEHRGSVISSEFLIANAWNSDHCGTLESLWVHIRRLRNKIEPDPNAPIYVVTVRGQGYCLPPSAELDDVNGATSFTP